MAAAGFPHEILCSHWLCWQNQFTEISNPISRNTGLCILDYKREKFGKGESLIRGGVWKVNWLSELYSCIHHNSSSRITQTLAVVEPMFCHLLSWCIFSLKLTFPLVPLQTDAFAHLLFHGWQMWEDGCSTQHLLRAPPESPVPWIQGSWISLGELAGSSPPRSVWANMQILGSANTNTVNYTQQKHTQQPGSHMIDIMLWLCCGTFIFIGKHFRQQFRFT